MKNLYIFLITLFVFNFSNAQIVDIPDENFKNVLLNYNPVIDINDDGEIQVSEAELVTSLVLVNLGIMSLEGISSFTNIIDIYIESNPLVSLDFSQNTNLEVIHCNDNELVSLNVSQNQNIRILECVNNSITSIDVSQNLNLLELWCGINNISNLDVTNNVNLEKLSFMDNEISEIDVTENVNITLLSFIDTNINNIDISQNINLEVLFCDVNELSELNVSQNPNLKRLSVTNNLLTNLDISQNPNLEKINCDNNFLQNLNIKNGNNLNFVFMFANNNPNLTCIQVDDVDYANSQDCDINLWCKDDWATYSEECILGVEDYNLISFTIYPNPAQDILNIETQQPIETLKIYNLQGQLIKEDSTHSINVSQLNAGLYFVQLTLEGKTVTKKFLKE